MRTAIARLLAFFVVGIVPIILLAPTASAANATGVFPNDKVYVQSSLSTTYFNVNLAAERLDDNSPLDLVFVSRCPTVSQCITLRNADLEDSPLTVASTTMNALNGRTYNVIINLDLNNMNKAGFTSSRRTNVLLHELGHAVGMNHTTRTTSIMQVCNCTPVITVPDSTDYAILNNKYAG